MMGCPEFEQLERLLAGALTAAEHDRVESHIEECPACHQGAPRDRDTCLDCGAMFPPPALKGIEVFA